MGQSVCRFGALLQVGCRAVQSCTNLDCAVSCVVYSKLKEQFGNRLSQKPPQSHYSVSEVIPDSGRRFVGLVIRSYRISLLVGSSGGASM